MAGIRRVINGDPIVLLPRFAYADAVHDEWERALYRRYKQTLSPGLTVLDVGASFGLYTLAAARAVGPQGRVFAFEPGRRTASALARHLFWNEVGHRVEVIAAAVAERSGWAVFRERKTSFVASLLDIAPGGEEHLEERVVPAVALDDFCRERRVSPDVVKIDVEGTEAKVLAGARGMLERRTGVVFLEVHCDLLGPSAADVFRELSTRGWSWEEVDAGPGTRHYVCTP